MIPVRNEPTADFRDRNTELFRRRQELQGRLSPLQAEQQQLAERLQGLDVHHFADTGEVSGWLEQGPQRPVLLADNLEPSRHLDRVLAHLQRQPHPRPERCLLVDPLPLQLDRVALGNCHVRGRRVEVTRSGNEIAVSVDGREYRSQVGDPLEVPYE